MAGVITNSFKKFLAILMGGPSPDASFPAIATGTVAFYLGWGNGTGQVATVADTTIFGEHGTARQALALATASTNTPGGIPDTTELSATMTAGANLTVDNVGVLDASSSGTLLVHVNFTAVALLNGDQIQFKVRLVSP